MLKNYFKIAWRNLVRNKAFSFINIAGLALGVTASLLIMLWVQDERSVDGFHANGKQLYQVYERNYYDGKVDAGYSTQGLLAEELKRVIPEIQYASGLEYASGTGTGNTFEAGKKINKMKEPLSSNTDRDKAKLARLRGELAIGAAHADRGQFAEDYSLEGLINELDSKNLNTGRAVL